MLLRCTPFGLDRCNYSFYMAGSSACIKLFRFTLCVDAILCHDQEDPVASTLVLSVLHTYCPRPLLPPRVGHCPSIDGFPAVIGHAPTENLLTLDCQISRSLKIDCSCL
jgi:hypothetical protein